MWVTLPPGTDVAALHRLAGERGVAFVKGTDFVLEGGENTLRLAYSGVTPEQIDEGVSAPRRRLPLAVRARARRDLRLVSLDSDRQSGGSAPVALAQHKLLGQRRARRRRGVGDHRHGLGDAAA